MRAYIYMNARTHIFYLINIIIFYLFLRWGDTSPSNAFLSFSVAELPAEEGEYYRRYRSMT